MEAKSLFEENKIHNQMINSSPRSKFLGKLVISSGVREVGSWMKWLFSDGVLPNATVILPHCFSLISFDPLRLEVVLYYIVLLYSIDHPLVYYLDSYLSFCLPSHSFLIF